jgi:hypothetical protein
MAAAVVLAGVMIGGAVSGAFGGGTAAAAATPVRHHRTAVRHYPPRTPVRHHPPRTRRHAVRAARWELDIPRIGVAASLLTLGDPHGGQLPVPSLAQAGQAGWYRFTAVPGRPGNAVIVGHVDTYTGPGVFYDLYLLRPGDPVHVDTGGRREDFTVRSVSELPKPRFPVNQVFGATNARRLWLITCGGDFDYATRHYLDNILVSASYQPGRGKHLRGRLFFCRRTQSFRRGEQ